MLFFKKKPKVAKASKKSKKKPKKQVKPKAKKELLIGSVSHYFPHVKAGAIIIKKGSVAVGDTIHIKGHTTDFKQKIASLQIDRVPVQKASKGDEIGVRIKARVRINDNVYKVTT